MEPSTLPDPHPCHGPALDSHHQAPCSPVYVSQRVLSQAKAKSLASQPLWHPFGGIGVICFNAMSRHPSSSSHPPLSTQASPTASGPPSQGESSCGGQGGQVPARLSRWEQVLSKPGPPGPAATATDASPVYAWRVKTPVLLWPRGASVCTCSSLSGGQERQSFGECVWQAGPNPEELIPKILVAGWSH